MGEAPRLKPRTVTEILDASFRLYRGNFIAFLGILAVAYVPVIILLLVIMGAFMSGISAPIDPSDEEAMARVLQERLVPFFIFYGLTLLLYMVAIQMATGALTHAVGSRYLNEPASIGKSYGHVFRIFMKYLGTILLSGLVVGLGMMLCLVPGIIFAIWFVFTSSVCVLEGKGGTGAMGRSRELARGNAGRIIGMGLLMLVMNWVLGMGIGVFAELVLPKLLDGQAAQMVVSQGIQQVFAMFLHPFFSVAWILLYYDIRIRKEAFDLEVLAKTMGSPAKFFSDPSAPPPTAGAGPA